MKNYYNILGIDNNASADEIKKAFRTLASKHHPDKGGDTAKFQEIQEAYGILGDERKRQQYDQERNNPFPQFQFRSSDFNGFNPFEDLFNFGHEEFIRQRTERKNKSVRISINVSLEETLAPIEKYIQLKTFKEIKNVKIEIPRGLKSHQTFRYNGLGDESNPNLPPGDLIVDVFVIPNDKFQISGSDLITVTKIDCLDAMTGCLTKIKGLDGNELEFNILPSTQSGAKYKLKGQGLFVSNTSIRGDLFVIVNLTVKKLDQKGLELVEKLKSQLNEN